MKFLFFLFLVPIVFSTDFYSFGNYNDHKNRKKDSKNYIKALFPNNPVTLLQNVKTKELGWRDLRNILPWDSKQKLITLLGNGAQFSWDIVLDWLLTSFDSWCKFEWDARLKNLMCLFTRQLTFFLAKNAHAERRGLQGETFLMFAVRVDHLFNVASGNILMTLLKRGANLEATNGPGWTVLHWAVARGHEDSCEVLLKHRANINAQDKFGWTPLMLAVFKGNDKLAKVFLEEGADIQLRTKNGQTAWSIAKSENKREYELLLWSRMQLEQQLAFDIASDAEKNTLYQSFFTNESCINIFQHLETKALVWDDCENFMPTDLKKELTDLLHAALLNKIVWKDVIRWVSRRVEFFQHFKKSAFAEKVLSVAEKSLEFDEFNILE